MLITPVLSYSSKCSSTLRNVLSTNLKLLETWDELWHVTFIASKTRLLTISPNLSLHPTPGPMGHSGKCPQFFVPPNFVVTPPKAKFIFQTNNKNKKLSLPKMYFVSKP